MELHAAKGADRHNHSQDRHSSSGESHIKLVIARPGAA
jgi:hypothetical protein